MNRGCLFYYKQICRAVVFEFSRQVKLKWKRLIDYSFWAIIRKMGNILVSPSSPVSRSI